MKIFLGVVIMTVGSMVISIGSGSAFNSGQMWSEVVGQLLSAAGGVLIWQGLE